MIRLALALSLLVAAPAEAQSGCGALGPSLAVMPDEPPALHGPAEASVARRAAIEAMPPTDSARPAALFELAEAYRALGQRSDEIRTLARFVRDHPRAPGIERVHHRLATALAASGHADQARQVWLRLVREFPTSDYVQAAFVSFGDYFVAQGDLEAAEQFYERALQFEGGRWLAYAHYRHAWALAQVGDRRALTELGLVASALGASPPQLGASAIRVAANGDQSALSATLACHATPWGASGVP